MLNNVYPSVNDIAMYLDNVLLDAEVGKWQNKYMKQYFQKHADPQLVVEQLMVKQDENPMTELKNIHCIACIY